jgi:hypothetical protein
VRSRAAGDLYLTLMSFERDGSHATLRMIKEPLVPWIWIGGMIVFFGAFIAWLPLKKGSRGEGSGVRGRRVRAGEAPSSLNPQPATHNPVLEPVAMQRMQQEGAS